VSLARAGKLPAADVAYTLIIRNGRRWLRTFFRNLT
jgi:hypothetical protein